VCTAPSQPAQQLNHVAVPWEPQHAATSKPCRKVTSTRRDGQAVHLNFLHQSNNKLFFSA
jgi:hypothetical protein